MFYHKNLPNSNEIVDEPLEPTGELRCGNTGMACLGKVFGIIGAVNGIIMALWFVGLFIYERHKPKPKPIPVKKVRKPGRSVDIINRNHPQICLGEKAELCMVEIDRYVSMLKRVCDAIELDDPTYKAMMTNFDDAVLHETLRFKGNSKNIPKYNQTRSIL